MFKYSDLNISPDTQHTGGQVDVSLKLTNTGKYQGDEVVQLYLHEETTPVITPVFLRP